MVHAGVRMQTIRRISRMRRRRWTSTSSDEPRSPCISHADSLHVLRDKKREGYWVSLGFGFRGS